MQTDTLAGATREIEAGGLLEWGRAGIIAAQDARKTFDLVSPAVLGLFFRLDVLKEAGYPEWRASRRAVLKDVEAVRLSFAARVPEGGLDRQSGMVYLPVASAADPSPLSWVIYFKGTELRRDATPSRDGGFEVLMVRALAALGFAVFVPDYAGMGDGMGVQEYCVPDSLAASGLDGLAAARHWMAGEASRGRPARSESGRLYILGYSEGGLSTMAATERLVTGRMEAPGLELRAAYPLAAPFDLMSAVPQLTAGPAPLSHPEFQVYIVLGWARAYPGIVKPEEILSRRTLESIVPLYDGKTSSYRILREISRVVGKRSDRITDADIFAPAYLEALRKDPESLPYYRLQSAARLDRLVPGDGLALVFAASPTDDIVRFSNSETAYQWAKEHSPQAEVRLVRLASRNHNFGAVEGLVYAMADLDRREAAR